MAERVYNFAAGPSVLPIEVLQQAQKDLLNYKQTGMSVMEMSHRSQPFEEIYQNAIKSFKQVLSIPDDYDILFLQGGASLQFAMVPMNLIGQNMKADYALTGNFATKAYEEARRYGNVRVAYSGKDTNFTHIPTQGEIVVDPSASYFHYCANNTIYGTAWNYIPDTQNVPLVADMSSEITSYPFDVSKFSLIYAGAQKNMAPAGLTVVIVKKNLDYHVLPYTPTMLRYSTHLTNHSMYNTPACFQIYMFGLQMMWILEQGGVTEMYRRKKERANLLYNTLENTPLFTLHAEPTSRSDMNITFRTNNPDLDKQFIQEAKTKGLVNLAGHRLVGGMRASLYNAMPLEGVKELCNFIEQFGKEHHV